MIDSVESTLVLELQASEERIAKIKNEIDKFEQVFKRVSNGFGSVKYLNEEYHAVIVSTRDLSTHLANLQKTIDGGAEDPNLRARAHHLNNQAITQLRRLQSLGMRVQNFIQTGGVAGDSQRAEKYASPLVDYVNTDKGASLTQMQLPQIQSEVDEQRAREMEQLESDIVQVNELFTTLATYVHDQGTMVDSIGQNIEVAYEKVEMGTRQLDSAVKHRKSARRKKCICLIIVLLILIILAIVLGVSLRK